MRRLHDVRAKRDDSPTPSFAIVHLQPSNPNFDKPLQFPSHPLLPATPAVLSSLSQTRVSFRLFTLPANDVDDESPPFPDAVVVVGGLLGDAEDEGEGFFRPEPVMILERKATSF